MVLLKPRVFGDDRGFFVETWNERTFSEIGLDVKFVQDNHSLSRRGILRGLHFQNPRSQGKLVWTVEGEIYDVAVDLRRSSPTFGKWEAFRLNADNRFRLWVPRGFAHGFYVTSERAQVIYKCDDYYAPEHEMTLAWNDPTLGIDWPIPDGDSPVLSPKDAVGLPFSACRTFD